MAKVTFLLGLAGSGKTHLSQQLVKETGAQVFEGLVHNQAYHALLQCLRDGKDCIIEEISFCFPKNRDTIVSYLSQVPGVEIEWICFENDLDSANWNITHRTNKGSASGHRDINQRVHGGYVYPDGVKAIPITRISQRL